MKTNGHTDIKEILKILKRSDVVNKYFMREYQYMYAKVMEGDDAVHKKIE